MEAPLIIAHRTSPAFAPENSLEGIRVTFEQGADGVEIDLRTSLDFGCFLMHDNTMRRTTGWPLPIELTPSSTVRRQRLRPFARPPDESGGTRAWSQQAIGDPGVPTLGSASATHSSDAATEGVSAPRDESRSYLQHLEGVPSLDEAIRAMPQDRLLAVDVKTPWSVFGLVKAVREHRMESRTLVWCSSALVVRYVVRQLPGVEVAYYKDFEEGPNNIEFIGRAGRIGAHAVSLDWRAINQDVVAAAHWLGLKVYSWHKEHPITVEKIAAGLDGLITDYPARAREQIKSKELGDAGE